MILHQLEKAPGSSRKPKRKGRGHASTLGKTAGRGQKGQYARGKVRRGFEGGQTPLHRRLPRRGFNNLFKRTFSLVNLLELTRRPDLVGKDTVTLEDLLQAGAIRHTRHPVKILAKGDLNRPVKVHGHAFSHAAVEKITAAGGEVIFIKN